MTAEGVEAAVKTGPTEEQRSLHQLEVRDASERMGKLLAIIRRISALYEVGGEWTSEEIIGDIGELTCDRRVQEVSAKYGLALRHGQDIWPPEHRTIVEAARGREVEIYPNTDTGEKLFAVLHPDDDEYWLGAGLTIEAALEMCSELGLKPVCAKCRSAVPGAESSGDRALCKPCSAA